ncbi:aprataxin and PNK-like factor isoform X1 [Amyelois transitella]|uniref:aprataxin and PNK-like factor isoform X1 n=1 Tax=Amyelois transitella TaxID=680683 RepID=UPI0029905F1B|nr:aprataxin and PNK-like factor isoform X1 [Amyelois transitella]
MGFKLVRVDKTDPCKIKLDVGTHLVGRGKFLHCDDKRVSRRHGELEVSDDAVKLTALHTNPCFYVKRNTSDRLILKQNESEDLRNGDKFGLLPVDCWYEVLYSPDDADDQGHQVENGRINTQNGVDNLDSTDVNHGIDAETIRQMDVDDDRINIDLMEAHDNGGSATVNAESSLNLAPQSSNEKNGQQDQTSNDQQLSPNESDLDQSQSLIQDLNLPQIMTSNNSEPAETIPQIDQQSSSENTIEQNGPVKIKNELLDQNSSIEQSPLKRPHPGTSDVKQEPEDTVKKIKTEGNDAPAGPSNDQNVQPPANPAQGVANPTPATPRVRERCMYGANCYRRNPIHKQEFSHPADPDWGSGAQGVCPWGRACVRRNPAHWAQNTHPPGTLPPDQRPQGKRQKRKKKRYSTDEDSGASNTEDTSNIILTGKRARKTVNVQKWSDSESNDEDPFQTDDEEEWQPSGSLDTDFDSQLYTQDE